MENLLKSYKDKLNDIINKLEAKIRLEDNMDSVLEDVRNELSSWGRDNLKNMYLELKDYVEKNSPDFIKNNEEKWKTMLDKAEALSEYGLYVAPIDLLKESEMPTKAFMVGAGTLLSSLLLTKIASKKAKLIPSLFTSILSGVAAYYVLEGDKTEKIRESAINYVEDARDWIDTAFENMYRIFKDAQ